MTIRTLAAADYDQAYALWQTERMGLNNVDDSREGIKRFLRRNPNTSFAAEENGALAGTILTGHDGRCGHILHACVTLAYQNRGIGTQLVEGTLDALRAEGISSVSLLVYSDNADGRRFGGKTGFSRLDILRFQSKELVALEWYD